MSCQVETILKMCPLVEQVCAVADSKQMFVVGLIVPNEAKVKAMQEKATGLPSTDFKEACQDKAVVKAFLAELTAHGLKCKWETEKEGFHSSATEHPFAEVLVTLWITMKRRPHSLLLITTGGLVLIIFIKVKEPYGFGLWIFFACAVALR